MKTTTMIITALFGGLSISSAQLPDPGMAVDLTNTALVITDPQNDFLSPDGVTWGVVGEPYINDGRTVVSSPHKVFGPETNDLVLQLRKRGISRVILGGMSANLCTESHMRELLEQGFEVAVVTDATAAAKVGKLDGYQAALTNFRMIANTVWTTEAAVKRINAAKGTPKVEALATGTAADPTGESNSSPAKR